MISKKVRGAVCSLLLVWSAPFAFGMNKEESQGTSRKMQVFKNLALVSAGGVGGCLAMHAAYKYGPSITLKMPSVPAIKNLSLPVVAPGISKFVVSFKDNALLGYAVSCGMAFFIGKVFLITKLGELLMSTMLVNPKKENADIYMNALDTAPEKIKEIYPLFERNLAKDTLHIDFGGGAVNSSRLLPLGYILEGAPGCGKTEIGRALAQKYNLNFNYIKATNLVGSVLHETTKNLSQAFTSIKEKMPDNSISIVFIDEIEELGCKRIDIEGVNAAVAKNENQVLTTLLHEVQGFDSNNNKKLFVLGATNRIGDVDPALKSRLQPISMDLPALNERIKAIENQTLKILEIQFTSEINTWIARETEHFSYRDLHALITAFARKAVSESKQSIDVLIDCVKDAQVNLAAQSSLSNSKIPEGMYN